MDQDKLWEEYREMAERGFSKFMLDELGDLHGQFSYLLAMAEIQLGSVESRCKQTKRRLELSRNKASLEHTTAKNATILAGLVGEHADVVQLIGKLDIDEAEEITIGAMVNGLRTATNALSREISRRAIK